MIFKNGWSTNRNIIEFSQELDWRTGFGTSRITSLRMLLGLTREENPLKPVVDGTRNFGDWHDDGGIS